MANPTMEIRSDNPTSVGGAAKVDMKFELVVIPVSDVDREGVLEEARMAARRRLSGRRVSRSSVHTAGLWRLDHPRQERHVGGVRLRPGFVPDRFRSIY
jgi:hypothetical protein